MLLHAQGSILHPPLSNHPPRGIRLRSTPVLHLSTPDTSSAKAAASSLGLFGKRKAGRPYYKQSAGPRQRNGGTPTGGRTWRSSEARPGRTAHPAAREKLRAASRTALGSFPCRASGWIGSPSDEAAMKPEAGTEEPGGSSPLPGEAAQMSEALLPAPRCPWPGGGKKRQTRRGLQNAAANGREGAPGFGAAALPASARQPCGPWLRLFAHAQRSPLDPLTRGCSPLFSSAPPLRSRPSRPAAPARPASRPAGAAAAAPP